MKTTPVTLRMTSKQRDEIRRHLFPGDGLEAVALALCGRRDGMFRHVLTVRHLVLVPYGDCTRTIDQVRWSSKELYEVLEKAAKGNLAVVKIHSHPGGYRRFSSLDDYSDREVLKSAYVWNDSDLPHASVIMLPDGEMFGRIMRRDGGFESLESTVVVGDDIVVWPRNMGDTQLDFAQRHEQLFGKGTVARLRQLTVAVVGCSGTGSPVIEQLARLGVGRLILIDRDKVEEKNLNRILNATRKDAIARKPKVEVMKREVTLMGLGTQVEVVPDELLTPGAVRAVAEADVVFGCMDGVEGRHILNRLCTFYLLPYFDIGVKLVADGRGGIEEAAGAVHYIQPEGSTLLDRGIYTMAQVKAEGLKRTDPEAYRAQVKAGYLRGVDEDRPAVISVNMQMASTAVNEFLARLHPYRLDDNEEFASVYVGFKHGEAYRANEGTRSDIFRKYMGHGDTDPLLGLPELSGGDGDAA